MRTDPYQHSVWLDVFGVLLVGAVLLGGAGYLLYHAGGAATGSAVGAAQRNASASASPAVRRPPAQRPRPPVAGHAPSAPNPLLGRRSAPSGGTAAPFSKSWRRQATPDLSGPASGGGGSGSAGGGSTAPSSPSVASSEPFGGRGLWEGGGSDPGWRAEARRLANRSRALSRQLGQMDRSRTKKAERNASSPKTADASTASANTNDRDVPSPPEVPLGGAEWLAAAGAAYALNRLRKQKENRSEDEEAPGAA